MSGDVDEGMTSAYAFYPCICTQMARAIAAGWQYALKFHGAVWHGKQSSVDIFE